jgi:hypothetical protein
VRAALAARLCVVGRALVEAPAFCALASVVWLLGALSHLVDMRLSVVTRPTGRTCFRCAMRSVNRGSAGVVVRAAMAAGLSVSRTSMRIPHFCALGTVTWPLGIFSRFIDVRLV